ncbi:hypothetical protein Agub_g1694 [Astrephomene gubernaculifera]|uniref:Uncharacterized protein n=1 Tax=Astrephomene gubernaculifera TaxID=47775 RepID=A0AAD3DFV0_9CHLO|nr:hypothetical protein Agub_g1694 [Astrephomene gubernaculifera]
MGSLVPGWDADFVVPRELQPDDNDIDKEPEREGYFARLRSHRHTHGGDAERELSSLSRISAPATLRAQPFPPSPSATATATARKGSPALRGTASPGSVQRRTTTQIDWSEELSSLRKAVPRRATQAVPQHEEGRALKASSSERPRHGATWWRDLEVGHLNERPDPQDAVDNGQSTVHRRLSYVPQFVSTHELDFGEMEQKRGRAPGSGER